MLSSACGYLIDFRGSGYDVVERMARLASGATLIDRIDLPEYSVLDPLVVGRA